MADTKKKILIIEDDKEIAAIEKDFLEINGFAVDIDNDGLGGQKHALSGNYALIILITLTHKEYDLLYFLASNPEMVFSKEQIYDRLWGEDTYGELKTVAVHINRLREKIEKKPSDPLHLQTVWGAGYRLMP